MPPKTVTHTLGARSFTCPHCGAIAHQYWSAVYLDSYECDSKPWVPGSEIITKIEKEFDDGPEKTKTIEFFKKKLEKQLFTERHEQNRYLSVELINLTVSRCLSCDKFAIWVADDLL